MGALGGGLSIAGGAAVAGCAGAGAKVCVGAAMGALTTTTSKITSDAVDLAISEGLAGERIKQMVDAKSRDEIFSAQNAKQVLKTAALGAAVGGAVQGLASACNGAANSSEYIDDVANVIQAGRRVPLELQGAEVVPKMLSFSLAQLMGAGTLANRVQKLAPEVSHKLVFDASKADFILSRTNNQKDFADQAVVALLREGFTLCADNSLTSNWGDLVGLTGMLKMLRKPGGESWCWRTERISSRANRAVKSCMQRAVQGSISPKCTAAPFSAESICGC